MIAAFRLPQFALILTLTIPVTALAQAIPGFFEPDQEAPQYPFYHGVASGDATP